MKYIIFVTIIFSVLESTFSQSLLKDDTVNPEAIFGNKISEQLRIHLDETNVSNCYRTSFNVKFELDQHSKIQNIKFSANLSDSLLINIIQKVIKDSENLWDKKKCDESNPSLRFLLPIMVSIYKTDCEITYGQDKRFKLGSTKGLEAKIDFTAMLKYQPINQNLVECLFCPSKEKFVGMVLNPILVNNGNPSH